jgi:lysophospholipase L1-like esterase
VVVFFGDSRAQSWPAPEMAGMTLVNRGIGAQTSAQVLGRLREHVLSLQPSAVVVQACINDLKAIGLDPRSEPEIVAGCLRNLRQIVDGLRAAGTRVVLTTVIPSSGDVPLARRMYWNDRIDAAVAEVNAELRTWAADGVVILDAAAIIGDGRGRMRRDYAADLLHLNDAGYRALNRELVRVLGFE